MLGTSESLVVPVKGLEKVISGNVLAFAFLKKNLHQSSNGTKKSSE